MFAKTIPIFLFMLYFCKTITAEISKVFSGRTVWSQEGSGGSEGRRGDGGVSIDIACDQCSAMSKRKHLLYIIYCCGAWCVVVNYIILLEYSPFELNDKKKLF